MKKIITVVLLLLAIMYPINMIKASEPQQSISTESVELISKGFVAFSNVTFNMSNHMSTGYTTLVMGSSTTYTINLSTILAFLEHYNAANVSEIYLQFDLQAVYTGYTAEQYQWLSSNGAWNSSTKRLALGTTMPASASAEIWWNVIGQSGGAPSSTIGSLRIVSVTLVVNYTDEVEIYSQISDWSELPGGTVPINDFVDTYEFISSNANMIVPVMDLQLDGTYDIYFDFDDTKLIAKAVTLPTKVTEKDIKMTLYFASTEYRFLWFFFDINASNPYNSDFLIWNLTTGEFQEIITGTVYGVPFVTGNGISTYNMAYVDLSIPWELEKIVSIRMSYQYRYHYLVGNPGSWYTVTSQDLYDGALTAVNAPWWNPVARWLYNDLLKNNVGKLWDYDQIEVVTDDYDLSKKAEFVNYINEKKSLTLTMNDVFPIPHTVGRIFLGQFDKFGSNAVEIKDIVVMEIRYINDGIEYSAPFPKQVITDTEDPSIGRPDLLGDFLEELWKFITSLWLIVSIGIGLGTARLVLGKSWSSHPIWFIGIATVLFGLLYLSYSPPASLW